MMETTTPRTRAYGTPSRNRPTAETGARMGGGRYAKQEQAYRGDRSLDGEYQGESAQVLGEGVAEGLPQGLRVLSVAVGCGSQEGRLHPAHVYQEVRSDKDYPEEGHREPEGAVNDTEGPAEHAPGDGLRGAGEVVPYPGDELVGVRGQEAPVLQKVQRILQVLLDNARYPWHRAYKGHELLHDERHQVE